jgi:hypothetical protein
MSSVPVSGSLLDLFEVYRSIEHCVERVGPAAVLNALSDVCAGLASDSFDDDDPADQIAVEQIAAPAYRARGRVLTYRSVGRQAAYQATRGFDHA